MKFAIILANGFEEIESITIIDIFRRANITVDIYGLNNDKITGSHNITILADKKLLKLEDISIKNYEGLLLPGGPAIKGLKNNSLIIDIIKSFYNSKKLIFAICAAPELLDKAGVLEDKKFTCYPEVAKEIKSGNYKNEKVVVDNNIITSQGVGSALEAAIKLIEIIKSKEEAVKLSRKVLFYN